jgi:hypothetical protein
MGKMFAVFVDFSSVFQKSAYKIFAMQQKLMGSIDLRWCYQSITWKRRAAGGGDN